MNRPRQHEFIADIRALRSSGDNAVEHTPYLGGGLRFSGFTRVSGRQFCNALRSHGKKAIFRLNVSGNIMIDCYDNIDPPTPTLKNLAAINPPPARKSSNYTRGAVVYSPYVCATVTSADIEAVLLDLLLLDVVLTRNTLTVGAVSPHSTNVVDGLHMQIQTNPRMRCNKSVFKPSLSFRKGGPARTNRPNRSLIRTIAHRIYSEYWVATPKNSTP